MMTFIMSHRETESRKMEKKEGENEKRRKGEKEKGVCGVASRRAPILYGYHTYDIIL